METKYIIDLISDKNDEFDMTEDNVAKVSIINKDGNNKHCRVMIEMSKNAMIGFGIELIRMAYKFKDGLHTHINPVEKNLISQNMGIYLTNDSNELILSCKDFGKIDGYIE